MQAGPEVEIARDELAALVDPDGLRDPHFGADPGERRNDVACAVAEPRIDRRREPRPDVDDGQHPQLAAGGELVVDEVHRPGLVRRGRRTAILPKPRLHSPLRSLVSQLQGQLIVDPMNFLVVLQPLQPLVRAGSGASRSRRRPLPGRSGTISPSTAPM